MKCTEIDNRFQTPDWLCNKIISLLPIDANEILEPTPGIGNLQKALINNGRKVISPASDYFIVRDDIIKSRFDAVVMNPPFSSKSFFLDNAPDMYKEATGMKCSYMFLEEMLTLSDFIITIMPTYLITDSDVRLRRLIQWGLEKVIYLPRSTFEYAKIHTAVFVLNKGHKGDIKFDFFEDHTTDQAILY